MEKQELSKKSRVDSKSTDKDLAKSKSNSSKNNLSEMDVAGSSTAASHIVRNISSDEKVVTGIDLSKPPPKPPRKLDPLSLSQQKQHKSKSDDDTHLHSSPTSKTEERRELQSASESPVLLQPSASLQKLQNVEGPTEANLTRDDSAKVNEARRLARERVLRKIKAEKEKLEEEEKRKLQELQTRQESSAVKVKRLQEKTLERVAQLKEQAERMQMQAKESEFEEEARRVASEQQVQSEEYMLRMKRLRQEARRRVKQQEKKEEMLAYQQEIELQQQLRIRKQQYDVSTTFIPAAQQTKPRNNQNNSSTNNNNRNRKVQISSMNPHQQYNTSHNNYNETDSIHQSSQLRSNNNNYYYSDEVYPQHFHRNNRHNYTISSEGNQPYREYDDEYDSNNNGNNNIYDEFNDAELQREENAYIAGDNAYLQQQDRQQRLYIDDTADTSSGDRRPWRPHTDSGNSVEEHRVSVPLRPATTNDSMSSNNNNSHGQYSAKNSGNDENGEEIDDADFASNTGHQMPRYAFADTNNNMISNNRDINNGNNRDYVQDVDRNNNGNLFLRNAQNYNMQSRASMDVSRDTQQQHRRRQELENAVSQWLSGEDDTSLAAKQDLYSPSKQSKSSNKSKQSNNNKTRNTYSNKANRSNNFDVKDDESSSWGSDSDEDNQNNKTRYKSHQNHQQSGPFPKQDMDLDDTADDAHSTVSDLTDQEELYKSSRKKASDSKILPKAGFSDNKYTHKQRNIVHDPPHATTSVTQQLQPIAPAKAFVPQPFQHNSPKILSETANNNLNNNSAHRSNNSKSQSSPEQISKMQQSTVHNRSVAHRTRKPKPFHALPVIPIAPYNPVPANY